MNSIGILKNLFFVFIITALLAPFCTVAQLKHIGLPEITNYLPKDYHAHPNSFGAVQDEQGIMYFANLSGVLEFDGVKWRTITLPKASSCTSLAIDDRGTIYVGGRSEFGYLTIDSLGRKAYVSLLHLLPEEKRKFNELWRTYNTESGILFTGFEQFILLEDNKAEVYYPKEKFGNSFEVDGKIYAVDQGNLVSFSKRKFTVQPWGEYFKEWFISSIIKLDKDKYLVGINSEGLFLVDKGELKVWEAPINQKFQKSRLDKISILSNKYLIFSSLLEGIFITNMNGEIIYHLNKENGLGGNNVTDIFLDKDQNLWATLINGISHIPLFKPFSIIDEKSGISGIPYSSVFHNEKLYLATSEGIFEKVVDDENTAHFQKGNVSGLVWNLSNIKNELFLGHVNGGYQLRNGRYERITESGTWAYIPLQDENYILSGTYNGIEVFEKKNNAWIFRNKIKGFGESSRFLVEDYLGDIWVSHGNKGVFRLRINKNLDSISYINTYNAENGLPFDYNNTVCKLGNEILICSQQGIYRYDFKSEKMKPFRPLNKILGKLSHVQKIIQTDEKLFWVIYDEGTLAEIEIKAKDDFEIVFLTNKFKDRFVSSFENIRKISSDEIILATQDGYVIYDKKKEELNKSYSTPLRAFISQAELISAPYSVIFSGYSARNESSLPYKDNSLRFSFAANCYEDIENVNYQYLLQGPAQKEEWSKWSNDNYKEFTNLHPGRYTVKVRAMNSYGKISLIDAYEFNVQPPWYRTYWMYYTYFTLFIIASFLFTKMIKNRFHRQRKRIELQQQQILWKKQKELEQASFNAEKEIMELQQDKLFIEAATLRQKETLLEQEKRMKEEQLEKEKRILMLEKEKFESELGYKNNELTSLTLHITQKNEILTKIKNQVIKAIKETTETEAKENLREIETIIQKGIHSTREWQRFRNHFDMVHDDILKRLKERYPELKTSSLKLCAYLKMRLSTKQIAILMNASPDSIAKARYRLRFKLGLNKGTRLSDFLNEF